jgi:tetratricopeptide (TPR) repeat protein
MGFFKRLFGRSEQQHEAVDKFTRIVSAKDQILEAIWNQYLACKVPLFKEASERAARTLSVSAEEHRAMAVGALASNLATLEQHPEEKLARMSAADRDLAARISESLRQDPIWKGVVADSCWWFAQHLLTRCGSDTVEWNPADVPPDVIEACVILLKSSISIDGTQAKFYGTLANTYMATMDARAAYDVASLSVQLDPQYVEGFRLKGNSAFMLGRLNEAEQSYKAGLAIDPNETGILAALTVLEAERHEQTATATRQQPSQQPAENGKASTSRVRRHFRLVGVSQRIVARITLERELKRITDAYDSSDIGTPTIWQPYAGLAAEAVPEIEVLAKAVAKYWDAFSDLRPTFQRNIERTDEDKKAPNDFPLGNYGFMLFDPNAPLIRFSEIPTLLSMENEQIRLKYPPVKMHFLLGDDSTVNGTPVEGYKYWLPFTSRLAILGTACTLFEFRDGFYVLKEEYPPFIGQGVNTEQFSNGLMLSLETSSKLRDLYAWCIATRNSETTKDSHEVFAKVRTVTSAIFRERLKAWNQMEWPRDGLQATGVDLTYVMKYQGDDGA